MLQETVVQNISKNLEILLCASADISRDKKKKNQEDLFIGTDFVAPNPQLPERHLQWLQIFQLVCYYFLIQHSVFNCFE